MTEAERSTTPLILFVSTVDPFINLNGVGVKLARLVSAFGKSAALAAPSSATGEWSTLPLRLRIPTPQSQLAQVLRIATLSGGTLPRLELHELLRTQEQLPPVVHLDTIRLVHLAGSVRRIYRQLGSPPPCVVASISDSYSLSQSAESKARLAWAWSVERTHLNRADVVHVVSQRDADWLWKTNRVRAKVVPLIGPRVGQNLPGFDDRLVDFAYIGSIRGTWGASLVDFVINYCPKIEAAIGRPVTISIAGSQQPSDDLRRALNKARFVGRVDDVVQFFSSARFSLVPSKQGHGAPNKALDGMAAGSVPVGAQALLGLDEEGLEACWYQPNAERIEPNAVSFFEESQWSLRSKLAIKYIQTTHSPESVKKAYLQSL